MTWLQQNNIIHLVKLMLFISLFFLTEKQTKKLLMDPRAMVASNFTFRAKIFIRQQKVSKGIDEKHQLSLQWPCENPASHSLREDG